MAHETVGLDEVKRESEKLKRRESIFVIFNIPSFKPVEFAILDTYERTNSSASGDAMDEKEMRKIFDICKSKIKKNSCCYVIYDFGFYRNDRAFRNMVCLITYIPDDHCSANDRVIYSNSGLLLTSSLSISKQMTFNSFEEFTFNNLVERCSSHKKN
ncbi:putative cofilin/tropomyosin-type actin-binding protein [Hamiltosporidium tvaerminnensis]|uniref:Putative cofilin/tropomyosin-type actin-binding protein n=2 Tax=Hamiltosporidium TaxID=1176354 RepID=A0A4Q9LIF8_9MICR|nr:cofilin [Hamiltosporidium tvaerminnensis]TBU02319.1 putative cofilin/tropomyosin-type actin-binding protein [Hamiltosporidium magnivora]TBU04319.1 putative cofilin/tropomyosin-type actin-binding protein [Hamiltosporidium tvaerminnensis]TBU07958.1 putative cofilin/tropomyosin-type actin-binding protein [Hamiltosporidium magnivora]TBU10742.1 putative cofilin/tropomyosin-type actin-binding protein [Hamiltosporidium tvaerminnensis]